MKIEKHRIPRRCRGSIGINSHSIAARPIFWDRMTMDLLKRDGTLIRQFGPAFEQKFSDWATRRTTQTKVDLDDIFELMAFMSHPKTITSSDHNPATDELYVLSDVEYQYQERFPEKATRTQVMTYDVTGKFLERFPLQSSLSDKNLREVGIVYDKKRLFMLSAAYHKPGILLEEFDCNGNLENVIFDNYSAICDPWYRHAVSRDNGLVVGLPPKCYRLNEVLRVDKNGRKSVHPIKETERFTMSDEFIYACSIGRKPRDTLFSLEYGITVDAYTMDMKHVARGEGRLRMGNHFAFDMHEMHGAESIVYNRGNLYVTTEEILIRNRHQMGEINPYLLKIDVSKFP